MFKLGPIVRHWFSSPSSLPEIFEDDNRDRSPRSPPPWSLFSVLNTVQKVGRSLIHTLIEALCNNQPRVLQVVADRLGFQSKPEALSRPEPFVHWGVAEEPHLGEPLEVQSVRTFSGSQFLHV